MRRAEVLRIAHMGLEVNVEYFSCLVLALSILAINYRNSIIQDKGGTDIREQAALFGVLADPMRLKLLRLLSQQQEPNA